jgi:SAM-dependent methyltransferase
VSYDNYSDQWQNKRKSGRHYAHDFLEKPAIYSYLDNLKGKRVLCLGCGSGEECDNLVQKSAKKVVGVDSSKYLIEAAKFSYSNPKMEFLCSKIEDLDFDENSFDLIFSSLTLHYVENWEVLFKKLNRWLTKDGKIVFSTHHPLKWGSLTTRSKDFNKFVMGYQKSKTVDYKDEIFGDYHTFRPIKDKLFGELQVVYYHRSISRMIREIITGGFKILDFNEPLPIQESQKLKPDFYEVYSKIPLFAIFYLVKEVSLKA